MHLLDWTLTKYDYWTFAFLVVAIIAFFYALIQIGGLPGKIAERRNHPHAEAVKLVGWIGLFTVFPWIHAIIWAVHDGLTIDVRSLPKEGTKGEVENTSILGIDMPRNEGPPETDTTIEATADASPPDGDAPTKPA
ncbi:MAG: DUF3302 domain-containing protein [Alphaproteobacteria bacterium]|nr:DUF3302 domain-containing protein [Alphaproteobacteria bacterium]